MLKSFLVLIGCLLATLVLDGRTNAFASNHSNTTAIEGFDTYPQHAADDAKNRRQWSNISFHKNNTRPPSSDYYFENDSEGSGIISIVVNLSLLKALQRQAAIIQTPTSGTNPLLSETATNTNAGGEQPAATSTTHEAPVNNIQQNERNDENDDDPPFNQFSQTLPESFTNWNQVLLEAAETGNDILLLQALINNADINTLNPQGESSLQLAIANHHSSTAILLIHWGADLTSLNDDINIVDITLTNLLAAQNEENVSEIASLTTILHHLMAAGGQPHLLDSFAWFAANNSAIAQTAMEQQGDQVLHLHSMHIPFESGDDMIEELWDLNTLHVAILQGSSEVVELLCQHYPDLVNIQAVSDDSGITAYPLNLAASVANPAMVSCLLAHGARIGRAHNIAHQQIEAGSTRQELDTLLCQSPVYFIFHQSHDQDLQVQTVQILQTQAVNDHGWASIYSHLLHSGQSDSPAVSQVAYQLVMNALRAGSLRTLRQRLTFGANLDSVEPVCSPQCIRRAPTPISLACSLQNSGALALVMRAGACVSMAASHSREFMHHCCGGLTNAAAIKHQESIDQHHYQFSENHSVLLFVFADNPSLVLQLLVLIHINQCDQAAECQQSIINICTAASTLPMLCTSTQTLQLHRLRQLQSGDAAPTSTGLQQISDVCNQVGFGHVSSLQHQIIAFLFFLPDSELSALVQQAGGRRRVDLLNHLRRCHLIIRRKKKE